MEIGITIKGFVFRAAWRDALSGYPEQVRREVYEAIIEYGSTGETLPLKAQAQMAFNIIRVQMDEDARHEAERAEDHRRAEAEARLLQAETSERMRQLANRRWGRRDDKEENICDPNACAMRPQCDRIPKEKESEKENTPSPLDSPILKEKDKEKEKSSSPFTRAREKETDNLSRSIEEDYAAELEQSDEFRENTCMALHITPETFHGYWQDFLMEQRAKQTVHSGGRRDFRYHAFNWMRTHHQAALRNTPSASPSARPTREELNRNYYDQATQQACDMIDNINRQAI